MQQHVFFLRFLIIDFANNAHESPHNEINGGVFIFHILDKMHIIAYIE
jgi:hypothetical protein